MISFKQFLLETRPQYLYHGTSLDVAKKIIKDKEFKGKTWHEGFKLLTPKKKVYGLSTSRIRMAGYYDNLFSVVFVIDPNKVKHRFKITPVDYYTRQTTDKKIERELHQGKEFEEFIRTKNLPISVVSKIIILNEPLYDIDELKTIEYIKKNSPIPVEMVDSF